MLVSRSSLLDALVACGYDRVEAKEHLRGWERAVLASFMRRVEVRVFGARGEANWYHVTNPAGEKEWVLRGTKVKAILEEEAVK